MSTTDDERRPTMPRPEQDPDEHDAQTDGDRPHDEVTRNGNPGVPQSEYLNTDKDLTPPVGPAEQQGSELSVGPDDADH